MKAATLFLTAGLAGTLSAQTFLNSGSQNSSDSSTLPIPGFSTTDTLPKDSSISDTLKKVSLTPIQNGFQFGVKWSFTSSDLFSDWVSQQKFYFDEQALRYKEKSFAAHTQWLMKPETQSFMFPVSLGFFHRIDTLNSMSFETSYGFRRQKSVFIAQNDTTHATIFENSSTIDNHQAELSVTYQHRFNREYFSVVGVDQAGFSLTAGAVPMSLFQLSTDSDNRQHHRSASMFGAGGNWGIGLFTEKQLRNTMMVQLFFNYHGTMTYGFSQRKELFKNENSSIVRHEQTRMTENFFELGFHAIATKKNRDENKTR